MNIGFATSSGFAMSSAAAGNTGLGTSSAVVGEPVYCLLRGHHNIVVVAVPVCCLLRGHHSIVVVAAGQIAVAEARLGGLGTLGNLAAVPAEEGIADAPADLRCCQSRRSSRDFAPIGYHSFAQSQPWYVSAQTAPEPRYLMRSRGARFLEL